MRRGRVRRVVGGHALIALALVSCWNAPRPARPPVTTPVVETPPKQRVVKLKPAPRHRMKITTAMGHAFGAALRKGEPLVVDPDGLVILDQDAGVVSVVCGDQAAAELTDYSAWLVDKLRPSPTCELLLTGDVVSCKQFAYRKPSVVMAFEHDGERMMLRGSVVARQFSHRPPSSLPAKPELNDEWIEKLQTARCP